MTNQELLEKLKEDMEMRGFSHYTKDAYYRKAKETIEYFNKPMEEVSTKELREFLMKYLREKKKLSERSSNYYNSVIRFIYDVVLDKPINYKQIPMYKKKRKLPKILSDEELNIFFAIGDVDEWQGVNKPNILQILGLFLFLTYVKISKIINCNLEVRCE